jgi:hypothetical protein
MRGGWNLATSRGDDFQNYSGIGQGNCTTATIQRDAAREPPGTTSVSALRAEKRMIKLPLIWPLCLQHLPFRRPRSSLDLQLPGRSGRCVIRNFLIRRTLKEVQGRAIMTINGRAFSGALDAGAAASLISVRGLAVSLGPRKARRSLARPRPAHHSNRDPPPGASGLVRPRHREKAGLFLLRAARRGALSAGKLELGAVHTYLEPP